MEPTPNTQSGPSPLGAVIAADGLLDNLPWAVLVLDEQCIIRRVNQQAARWSGTLPEALLGRPLAGAGLPPAISATLRQLLVPGKAESREVYLPQQEQWIAFSATRQPGGWVVYGQDITPQKQREEQYQALAENTPDVLTRWTPDLRLRYANAAFAAQTGQPLAALLGRTFGEMELPADITAPYLAALQRVFDSGRPQEHYNFFPTPQGTAYYYSRLVPELRDGQVETVLGIARDITQLKQTEAETLRLQDELARRTTDQYHALFHSMDQGFCVLELLYDDTGQQVVDFRYQKLNPVFSQQSGIPEGAQGKTSRELMPDLEPFWFDTYGRVARTGEAVRLEHYVPQVSRWFDVHTFRVGAPAARQVGVLFSDITARKRAEEQLRLAAEADSFRLRLADVLGPLADPVAMQEAMTRLARQHFKADRCFYGEIEAGQVHIRRDAAADGLPSVAGTYALADFALLQAVIAAGRPFSVRDVRQDESVDENLRQLCVQLQVISYLDVPVLKNGQAVEVLCLVQSAPRGWTAAEVALAAEVAERTGAAVERARAEHALAESEAKYRSLFNSIDEGFCLLERLDGQPVDFGYLEANAAFARHIGRGDVVGHTIRELFPGAPESGYALYEHVWQTGEPRRAELDVASIGHYIELYAFCVEGAAGKRLAVVFQNITARKRHEANLVFLAEVSEVLVRLTNIDDTMAALGEKLGAQFHASVCLFTDIDEAAGLISAGHDWHKADVPSLKGEYRYEDFHSEEFRLASRAGETYVVRNGATDPRVNGANLAAISVGAYVNVPLVRHGEWLFNLTICDTGPRDWRADEVELMRELTTRIWTRLERARAEKALAVSEEQYRTLFTSIDEGFCTVEVLFDAQGQATDYRFLEANPAFVRQIGLENAVGRTMRELAPAHEAFWFDTYGRVARTGEAVRFEHEAAALGKFYDVFAFRIGAPAENRVAILFNDVAARKRAEEALRQSEEQFRLFVTASSDILYRMDAGWQHMLQLDGRNLLADTASPSTTWLETYIPPADQPAVAAAIQAAIAGPHFFALEHRVVQTDGSVGWTSSHAVPVRNARGELVEWFGTATDITARKQAEEALRLSEAKYRALFDKMHQGFGIAEILVDEAGRPVDYRMLEINPQFEQLTGQSRDTFLDGRTVREIAPELEDEWYAFYGNVGLTGVPAHCDIHAEAWNRWFEVTAYQTGQPEQRQVGILYSEITERKQVEQQLAEFNIQLEQRVARRTQQLQESRDLLHGIADSQAAFISAFKAIRDEHGRIVDLEYVFVNSVTEQLDTRHPMAGQRFLEVFPDLKDSGYLDSYRRVIETGVRDDREAFYDDGKLAGWFRSNATKLDDGVLVVGEDVTARKQAEQERTRNLRLLEQAEAVAGLGSWDYDLLSKAFQWSEGMYRLFGLPPGQAIDPGIYLDYVVDEDRPRAERLVHCLTMGSGCVEDILRLRVGEQVKTVRIKSVVLPDEAGRPVRVLGVDLDISELQRLEADNLRLRLTQQQALFEAVQAAQEAERKRMAESLHNGIGQILYATKLRLDRLHAPVLDTAPSLAAARNEADQLLGEAIRQTRALSHELVPMVLEEFGLEAALEDIGHKMSTPQLRLHSHVVLDEAAGPLAPTLQMALYRMAQELAQNIVKHAHGATQAGLELETMPGWVLLRAQDNGAGFAQGPSESPGLGLRSIRDRVALLGGQLETGSVATGGAYVRIRIPLPVPPAP